MYEYFKVYDVEPTHPSIFYSLSLDGGFTGRVEPMRGKLHSVQDAHCRANIQRPTHSHIKCIVANSPIAQMYVFVIWEEARENPCGEGRTQSSHRVGKFKDIYSLLKKVSWKFAQICILQIWILRRLQTELQNCKRRNRSESEIYWKQKLKGKSLRPKYGFNKFSLATSSFCILKLYLRLNRFGIWNWS